MSVKMIIKFCSRFCSNSHKNTDADEEALLLRYTVHNTAIPIKKLNKM